MTSNDGSEFSFAADGVNGEATRRSERRSWPFRTSGYPITSNDVTPDSPWRDSSWIVTEVPLPDPNEDAYIGSSASREIRGWILSEETLLWSDRPLPGIVFARRDKVLFLLFPLYLVIALLVLGEAIESRSIQREGIGAVSDVTLGLICAGAAAFVAFGFYAAIGRHLVDTYRRETTIYGLTNQRAIVQTPRSVSFLPLDSMDNIRFESIFPTRGTISCRSDIVERLTFGIDVTYARVKPIDGPLFRDILEPEHVNALMIEAQAAPGGKR